MMKKLIIAIFALLPLGVWAQDDSWEVPEEEQPQQEVTKVNPDQKYLKGAVPTIDGSVVFSKTVNAPGKTASQLYELMDKYMGRLTHASNQINSRVVVSDKANHEVAGSFEEWLVFKQSALSLDRTRFYYILKAECKDGQVDITMNRLRYLYEEERSPQRMKAEEWITDKEALNKKGTKLLPVSGKFRRKTVDRKDFLFNKFESLLK